jgi:hypothetical protein
MRDLSREEQEARIALLQAQAARERDEGDAQKRLLNARATRERLDSTWHGRTNLRGVVAGIAGTAALVHYIIRPLSEAEHSRASELANITIQRDKLANEQAMATVAVQRAKLEKDNQKLQQTQRELETQQTSLSEKIAVVTQRSTELEKKSRELEKALSDKAALAKSLSQENALTREKYSAIAEEAAKRVTELEMERAKRDKERADQLKAVEIARVKALLAERERQRADQARIEELAKTTALLAEWEKEREERAKAERAKAEQARAEQARAEARAFPFGSD